MSPIEKEQIHTACHDKWMTKALQAIRQICIKNMKRPANMIIYIILHIRIYCNHISSYDPMSNHFNALQVAESA